MKRAATSARAACIGSRGSSMTAPARSSAMTLPRRRCLSPGASVTTAPIRRKAACLGLAVAQQRLADDVDRQDVLHSDRRDGMPTIAPAHSSCPLRVLERPSAGHLQNQNVTVIGIGDQHRASISVGVYMDVLDLDLGDDLGEMEDLHGDLAGAGGLGVEDVIGEI